MIKWGEHKKYKNIADVEYEFKVGYRVETFHTNFFKTFTRRGTIIARKAEEKHDTHWVPGSAWALSKKKKEKSLEGNPCISWYEPVYEVELDNNKGRKWFDQYQISL